MHNSKTYIIAAFVFIFGVTIFSLFLSVQSIAQAKGIRRPHAVSCSGFQYNTGCSTNCNQAGTSGCTVMGTYHWSWNTGSMTVFSNGKYWDGSTSGSGFSNTCASSCNSGYQSCEHSCG